MLVRNQQKVAPNLLFKRFHGGLFGVGNKRVNVAGCMDLQVSLTNRNDKTTETFVIVPDGTYPDISLRGTLCEKLGLI